MAKIAFFFSHNSHQNVSMGLSRKLLIAGHEVIYSGPTIGISGNYLKQNAETQGFKYVPLELYSYKSSQHMLRYTGQRKEMYRNYMFNLFQDKLFDGFISTEQPDLLVIDTFLPFLAIVFYRYNIPIVFASSALLTTRSVKVPPLDSTIIPHKDNREEIYESWEAYLQKRKIDPNIQTIIQQLAHKHKFPLDKYFYLDKCMVVFGLKFPEIIYWPEAFDFPRLKEELNNKYYLGGLIDIHRKEIDLPELCNSGKPIVYCMLGTRSKEKNDRKKRFLQALIHAFIPLTQYHFIVSVGDFEDQFDSSSLPSHVQLYSFVPQIKLLQKSSVMINHAGGGSVKQCIRFGVPMLCIPHDNDQFGNAARVKFHQLGIRIKMLEDEFENLGDYLQDLLNNPMYKAKIAAFQKLFVQAESSNSAEKILENLLQEPVCISGAKQRN